MKKLYVTHKTSYSFEAGPLSGLQQIKKTPYSVLYVSIVKTPIVIAEKIVANIDCFINFLFI